MSTIMTFEEIKQNHEGKWVLIAYTKTDENLQVIKGEVIAHSVKKKKFIAPSGQGVRSQEPVVRINLIIKQFFLLIPSLPNRV